VWRSSSNWFALQGLVKGTNCSTIGRAQLEWWQADADGEYVDSLRATLYTNAKGQYKYETEAPGLYVMLCRLAIHMTPLAGIG
jgi:protocatechuate 3,4-dioxygenase beta subunit